MSDPTCSHERRELGLAYPRTCQECGLGPCKKPVALKSETEVIADQIAGTIFYHISDFQRRKQLEGLLIQFAVEVRRGAIEP